jgi:hypothetical protein
MHSQSWLLTLNSDRIEIAHKWIRLVSEADYELLPKPSAKAIPMPVSQKAKDTIIFTQRRPDDIPMKGDVFVPGFVHEEFNRRVEGELDNPCQVKVDLAKENQIWYYLGESSTEAKAQFTEDPAKRRNNPKGHFLSTIPKPVVASSSSRSYPASYPGVNQNIQNAAKSTSRPSLAASSSRLEKPYEYKPRASSGSSGNSYSVDPQAYRIQQNFLQESVVSSDLGTDTRWRLTDGVAASPHSTHPPPSTQPRQSPTVIMGPPSPLRSTQNTQPSSKPNNPFSNGSTSSHTAGPQRVSFNAKYSPLPESLVKKYPYLTKQFNRAASTYKSPYRQSPPHGFMNGYEGDLKGYLQQNPDKLGTLSNILNQSSSAAVNPLLARGNSQHSFSPAAYHSAKTPSLQGSFGGQCTQQPTSTYQGSKASQFNSWEKKDTSQLHPAIRQDYGMFHHQYGPAPQATGPPQPTENTVQQADHFSRQQHLNQASNAPPSQYYCSHASLSQMPPHHGRMQASPSQLGRQTAQAPNPLFHPPQQPGQNQDKPLYPHQQYFQKPAQSQQQARPASQEGHEVPDVPIDSASVVENIVGHLRRHAKLLGSSSPNATKPE